MIMRTFLILLIGLYIGADFTYRNLSHVEIEVKPVMIHAKSTAKEMTISAYSLSKKECDSDLKHTATMSKPSPGTTAAVSRDNLHLLGKKVYIEGHGVRKVTDVMNKRFKNRIDLLMSKKEAKKFGVDSAVVAVIN